MSKYKYEGYGVIRDTEIDFPYHTDDIAELLEEKDQQISDLQSQLAEKDEQIKRRVAVYEKQFIEQTNENCELKQQLAEAQKPKEIRFNGFVVDCNYDEARKVLQEDILKMWEENKKLKESEELSNYAKCILENKKLEQEIQELKQQLAEEDKEVKQLKLDLGMFKSVNEFLNRYGIEKAREVLLQTEKTKNQDKILFALEQLEKVKELLNTDFESIISWIDPYEDGECLTSMTYNHNNTIKIIDNQIHELKGEE